ncbi:MAG TPA: MerR family transcriptional regulator [Polyangiaceae bacterium]|nr:MerR family transcriptional regulator [Polyangiaceae bacterium]
MKIGELAARAGVTVDTIRFYERRRLLPRAARTRGGYRSYSGAEVERLALIKFLQGLGISLVEIARMLTMFDAGRATCDNQAPTFAAVVGRIDRELEQLQKTRRTILDLMASCRAGRCALPNGCR